MKLRTLHDMEEDYYLRDDGVDIQTAHYLREEAKKWISELDDDKGKTFIRFTRAECDACIKWIKYFFHNQEEGIKMRKKELHEFKISEILKTPHNLGYQMDCICQPPQRKILAHKNDLKEWVVAVVKENRKVIESYFDKYRNVSEVTKEDAIITGRCQAEIDFLIDRFELEEDLC